MVHPPGSTQVSWDVLPATHVLLERKIADALSEDSSPDKGSGKSGFRQ